MTPPTTSRRRRGIARSVRLFRSFLVEQTDPAQFYGSLAQDSVDLLSDHTTLAGARMLDVGAGPEQFADVFREAGVQYVPVDRDTDAASIARGGLAADAHRLPVATDSMDITFSSNLIEHVEDPDVVAAELLRVTKPGGLVFMSYTNWLSPWGGHETSPWHWLGGARAARRYERRHGHPPKNRIGENMFAVSVAWGMGWASRQDGFTLLTARPRYLPDWARGLVRIPVLREFLTWNLLVIARKDPR